MVFDDVRWHSHYPVGGRIRRVGDPLNLVLVTADLEHSRVGSRSKIGSESLPFLAKIGCGTADLIGVESDNIMA